MRVYTPNDIESVAAESAGAPLFAVFGKPIGHSLSPPMQNAALEELSKFDPSYARAKYLPFEVEPDALRETLEIFRKKNFRGINLTIPHKVLAMSAVDEFDESARIAGACNTLLRTENGWRGFNTDGFGLETAIESAFGVDFRSAKTAIIGAGGAARGAAFWACSHGCPQMRIFNRSPERLNALETDLKAEDFDTKIETFSLDGAEENIGENFVVVNATSIGLGAFDTPVLDFAKLPRSAVFFDMPYRRDGDTSSVAAAREAGIAASDGLPMLAWQGAKSFSIWTGATPPGELMLKTLRKAR